MEKEDAQEKVLCVDIGTGKTLWEFPYECDYAQHLTLDPRFRSGPRATPAVDDHFVYTIGTTGQLYCLEAETGNVVWHADLLELGQRPCPEYGYCNSPLVVGDRLFVHPGGQRGNALACLDKRTGRTLWTSLDDRIGWATPVMIDVEGTPQVVYFTGEAVVGVAPDTGHLLWRYRWQSRYDLNIASPIYSNGHLFISSIYGVGCALLRLKPQGDPQVIYKSKVMQNHFSTCVLYQGCLYGFSNDRLRCVEFETGKLRWDKLGLGRGSLMIAEGQLIILGEGGELVLAEASPEGGYSENARWQALEGLCWNAPVLAGGLLYARNQQEMIAVDLVNRR